MKGVNPKYCVVMKKKAFVISQPYFEYRLYYCPGHEWNRNIEKAITYDSKQLAKKHLYRLQTFATNNLKKLELVRKHW